LKGGSTELTSLAQTLPRKFNKKKEMVKSNTKSQLKLLKRSKNNQTSLLSLLLPNLM
jgi:hypothetical protein